MRIEIVRSGGLLGVARRVEVDLDALAPAARERLLRLMARANLEALPDALGTPAPDRYQWSLSIEQGASRRVVRVHEAGAPAPLRALLHALFEQG